MISIYTIVIVHSFNVFIVDSVNNPYCPYDNPNVYRKQWFNYFNE